MSTHPLPSDRPHAMPIPLARAREQLGRMTRSVEISIEHAMDALLKGDPSLARAVLVNEPLINAMEVTLDESIVRCLRESQCEPPPESPLRLDDEDIRLVVAILKITKDLERMGDHAQNIARRVLQLAEQRPAELPRQMPPMIAAVRGLIAKCMHAVAHLDVELAGDILRSDDLVDQFRDELFAELLAEMSREPQTVAQNVQFLLASRHLERIADHATNIAEEVIYWRRGLDVRHGHMLGEDAEDDSVQPLSSLAESGHFISDEDADSDEP